LRNYRTIIGSLNQGDGGPDCSIASAIWLIEIEEKLIDGNHLEFFWEPYQISAPAWLRKRKHFNKCVLFSYLQFPVPRVDAVSSEDHHRFHSNGITLG